MGQAGLDNPAVAALPVESWVLPRGALAQPADCAARPARWSCRPRRRGSMPACLALALRTGTAELWVLGECAAAARHVRARGVRRARQRAAHARFAARRAVISRRPRRRSALRAAVRRSSCKRQPRLAELAFVYPEAAAPLALEGARARFYPGDEIVAGQVPALGSLRLRLDPGARVAIAATGSTQPAAPRRGGARLRAASCCRRACAAASPCACASPRRLPRADGRPQVAYRFDPLHTAFGPAPAAHAYTALGRQRIHALALTSDGRRAGADCGRHASRPRGCRAARRGPGWAAHRARTVQAWAGLWPAALLLQRRRCRKRAACQRAGIDCEPLPVLKGLYRDSQNLDLRPAFLARRPPAAPPPPSPTPASKTRVKTGRS